MQRPFIMRRAALLLLCLGLSGCFSPEEPRWYSDYIAEQEAQSNGGQNGAPDVTLDAGTPPSDTSPVTDTPEPADTPAEPADTPELTDTTTADADVPGPECTPLCDDKICGDDGCGGSCGVCGDDEACVEGSCNPLECGICPIGTSCTDETASCEPGSCTSMLHKFLLEGVPNGLYHHYILYNLEVAYTAAWAQFGETPGDEAAVKEAVIIALSGDTVPETASLLALGSAEMECLVDWSQLAVCAVGACGLGDSVSCTPETAQSDECIACIVTECDEFKPQTGLSLNPGEYPECHPTEKVCGDAGEVCLETSEESCITLTCGVCDPGALCSDVGQCEPGCEPSCDGKFCGSDGCGGECGDPCLTGTACVDGACIDAACAGLEDAYVAYNTLEPGQVEALDWHQVYKQLTFHVLNRVGQECPAGEPLNIGVLEECAVDAINYLETDDAYTLGVYGATTEGCLNCWADLSVQMQVSCNEPCWDIVTAEQTDAAVSDRCLQCLQQSLVVPEDGETTIASAFQACSGKDFITAGSEACFGGQCACESAEMDCLGPDACALLSDTLESFGLNPQESLDAALNATHSAAIACFTSGYSGYSAATCVSDLLNQGGEWAPPPALAQLVSTTTECLGCWGWLGEMMQEDCGADCAVFDAGCLDCMANPTPGNNKSSVEIFADCSGIWLVEPGALCGDGLCDIGAETPEECPDDCGPHRAILSVDMNCSGHPQGTPVYIMTSLTDPAWQLPLPMFESDDPGVWRRSLAVANQGDAIEYKYLVEEGAEEDLLDNAAAGEEVDDGGCVTGVDWANGYASRKSPAIDGLMTLGTDTFGQCVGCDDVPPNGTVGYLTLQVDLAPVTPLPPGCDLGVQGTWATPTWQPGNSPIFEALEGTLYEASIFAFHGATVDYQFFYDGPECEGDGEGSIILETVAGQLCMGGPGTVAHRSFQMPESGNPTVGPVCWSSCAPCGPSPAECNNNGTCEAALGETVANCVDCGGQSFCGDGVCDADQDETPESCAEDCTSPAECGDGLCEQSEVDSCPEDCCAGSCGGNTCGWDGCTGVCGSSCPEAELCVNGNCSDGGIENACNGVDQQLLDEYAMDLSGNLLQNTRNDAYSCAVVLGQDAPLDALVDCTAKASNGDSGGGTPNLHGYSSVEVSYDCLACWGELGVCVTSKCDDVCVNGEPSVACKECIADQCDFAECSGMSMFGTDCTPVCGGKDCGDDGCGGTCGECGLNEICDNGGVCVTPSCQPGIATCANTSSREVCSANGMTLTTENCPAQSACLGGECVSCDGDPETQPAAAPYVCNPYCPAEVSCDDSTDLCAVTGQDATEACGIITGLGEAGATCEVSTDCLPGHVCDTDAGDPAVCRALCIDNSDCESGICSGSVSIGTDSVRTCESIACEPDCGALQESCGQDDGCGGVCSGCPEGEVCDPGSLTCVEDSPCQAFCSAMSATCDSELSTQDWGDEGCLAACNSWPKSGSDNPNTLPYEHSLACRQHYLEEAVAASAAAEPTQGFCDLAGLYSGHCIDLGLSWPDDAQSTGACPDASGPGSAGCPYRLNQALIDGPDGFCEEGQDAYTLNLGVAVAAAVPWSFTLEEAGPSTFIASGDGGPIDAEEGLDAGPVSMNRAIEIPHLPGKALSFVLTVTLDNCPNGQEACTSERRVNFRADFCPPVVDFLTPSDPGVSLSAGADNVTVFLSGVEEGTQYIVSTVCGETTVNEVEVTTTSANATDEDETQRITLSVDTASASPELEGCSVNLGAKDLVGNTTTTSQEVILATAGCVPTCGLAHDVEDCHLTNGGCTANCGQSDGCGGVCPSCPSQCSQWFNALDAQDSGRYQITANDVDETVYCHHGNGDGFLSMTGGGWTLFGVVADDGQNTWTASNAAVWEEPPNDPILPAMDELDQDYASPVAIAKTAYTELAFAHHAAQAKAWLSYGIPRSNIAKFIQNAEDTSGTDCKAQPEGIPLHDYFPKDLDLNACTDSGSCASVASNNLVADCLCDTNLYISIYSWFGQCEGCGDAQDLRSVGPTWHVAGQNGCGFDAPGALGSLGPNTDGDLTEVEATTLGYAEALGLNTGLNSSGTNTPGINNYHMRMYGRRSTCGNGQVEFGEACDDGNRANDRSCSADCRLHPHCGETGPDGDPAAFGQVASFGESLYAICPSSKGRFPASHACESMGARLVKVESIAEQSALVEAISDAHSGEMIGLFGDLSFWLGLNRSQGAWGGDNWDLLKWPDETVISISDPQGFFPQAEPNDNAIWMNTQGNDSVYLIADEDSDDFQLWGISAKSEQRSFICEFTP
ncbi:MAG: hypothetical protein ACPGU1_02680 [Myxococcota bacterium]